MARKKPMKTVPTQFELMRKMRGSWNGLTPVTRVIPNKKAYTRKVKMCIRDSRIAVLHGNYGLPHRRPDRNAAVCLRHRTGILVHEAARDSSPIFLQSFCTFPRFPNSIQLSPISGRSGAELQYLHILGPGDCCTGHPGQPVALSSKNASANGHCRSYHGHMAGLFLFGCLNGDSLFIEVPGPEGDTHSSLRCWCPGDYAVSYTHLCVLR